jgi:pimeloyl-ACP methyl ester carboxylesterase
MPTSDGLVLRGQTIVRSSDWAVLMHDLGEDIDAWRGLPRRLAADGLSIIALDLRGHGGSDGEPAEVATDADADAGIEFAKGMDARRVYAIAAGRSCAPTVREAIGRCNALAMLAPVDALPDWGGLPRLAVVGSTSAAQQAVAESFRQGPGWSMVAHVPFNYPGLGVLRTSWGSNVIEYVAGFLKGQRLTRSRVP